MVAPEPKVAAHPKEASSHWYTQQGQQIETVPNADGTRQIKPTLVHARKLQLAPGVTTVIRCASAPQLVEWQIGQGILAALTLPRRQAETDLDFLARVREDSKETAAKAAEGGTAIHAAIQDTIQGNETPAAYRQHVAGILAQLDLVCGPQGWRSEIAVAHPWGFGTKADLASDEWIVDFKSKDGDQAELDALTTYDEHAMQLAATEAAIRTTLGGPPRSCGILFTSRTHPGAARVVGLSRAELERGLAMFRPLLIYWQQKNRFRPSWALDVA